MYQIASLISIFWKNLNYLIKYGEYQLPPSSPPAPSLLSSGYSRAVIKRYYFAQVSISTIRRVVHDNNPFREHDIRFTSTFERTCARARNFCKQQAEQGRGMRGASRGTVFRARHPLCLADLNRVSSLSFFLPLVLVLSLLLHRPWNFSRRRGTACRPDRSRRQWWTLLRFASLSPRWEAMRWRPTTTTKKKITTATRTRQDEERRESAVPREPDCVRETYMSDVLTTGRLLATEAGPDKQRERRIKGKGSE